MENIYTIIFRFIPGARESDKNLEKWNTTSMWKSNSTVSDSNNNHALDLTDLKSDFANWASSSSVIPAMSDIHARAVRYQMHFELDATQWSLLNQTFPTLDSVWKAFKP